jgi:hypothetical protein
LSITNCFRRNALVRCTSSSKAKNNNADDADYYDSRTDHYYDSCTEYYYYYSRTDHYYDSCTDYYYDSRTDYYYYDSCTDYYDSCTQYLEHDQLFGNR